MLSAQKQKNRSPVKQPEKKAGLARKGKGERNDRRARGVVFFSQIAPEAWAREGCWPSLSCSLRWLMHAGRPAEGHTPGRPGSRAQHSGVDPGNGRNPGVGSLLPGGGGGLTTCTTRETQEIHYYSSRHCPFTESPLRWYTVRIPKTTRFSTKTVPGFFLVKSCGVHHVHGLGTRDFTVKYIK